MRFLAVGVIDGDGGIDIQGSEQSRSGQRRRSRASPAWAPPDPRQVSSVDALIDQPPRVPSRVVVEATPAEQVLTLAPELAEPRRHNPHRR